MKKYLILFIFIFGCNSNPKLNKVKIPVGDGEMTMIWIPSGSFMMGSSDSMAKNDEMPIHKVELDGFWISETAVTNNQFASFVKETNYVTTAEIAPSLDDIMSQLPKNTPPPPKELLVPGSLTFINSDQPAYPTSSIDWWKWSPQISWKNPGGKDSSIDGLGNHPVVHVSWYDAKKYSLWLNMELPTEAQWEYAAKLGGVSNHREINIWQGIFPISNNRTDGHLKTNPVKYYKPNNIGLYDMAGNVWEWVRDWYRPNTYSMKNHRKNPLGPNSSYDPLEPTVPKRVTRGGSFLCNDQYCAGYRPTARMKTSPDTSLEHTGFRCIMTEQQMNKFLKKN